MLGREESRPRRMVVVVQHSVDLFLRSPFGIHLLDDAIHDIVETGAAVEGSGLVVKPTMN